MDFTIKMLICASLFLGIQAEIRWLLSLKENEESRERILRFLEYAKEREDEENGNE